jgi:hypothetical protein
LLSEIAEIGKIRLVSNGEAADALAVRKQYAALKPLAELGVGVRGWTLDVLRLLKKMERKRFTIADAYQFVRELTEFHPDNQNVKPKIRQQLIPTRASCPSIVDETQFTLSI